MTEDERAAYAKLFDVSHVLSALLMNDWSNTHPLRLSDKTRVAIDKARTELHHALRFMESPTQERTR